MIKNAKSKIAELCDTICGKQQIPTFGKDLANANGVFIRNFFNLLSMVLYKSCKQSAKAQKYFDDITGAVNHTDAPGRPARLAHFLVALQIDAEKHDPKLMKSLGVTIPENCLENTKEFNTLYASENVESENFAKLKEPVPKEADTLKRWRECAKVYGLLVEELLNQQ